MEIRYHICDHCGKQLNPMKDYEDVELDKYGLVRADLCTACYNELDIIIQKFLNRSVDNG